MRLPSPARSNLAALALLGLVLGLAAATEAALGGSPQGAFWQDLLFKAGLGAVLAVSLNLVNGIAGQFSLGHAGFMALGAYAAAWASKVPLHELWLWQAPLGPQLGLAAGLLLAAAVAGAAGWLVGQPSLRLKGDYLAIVTLGFGEMTRVALNNSEPLGLGGGKGYNSIPLAAWGLTWVWGLLALATLACLRLLKSSPGRALLSVREDEVAAEALGLNTTRLKVGAFVASAALAGMAGALNAHNLEVLNPKDFDFTRSVEIVVMVVLGGMGSVSGALLAAILLTLLRDAALPPLKDLTGVDLRMVLYSLALILLMLFRPQGLLGRREVWDFFKNRKRP